MQKDFIKLEKTRTDCYGDWYVAYINPKYVEGDTLDNIGRRSRYNLNSVHLARIGYYSSDFRNGTRWFIHSATDGSDKYFEGIEETVAISLDRVKEIMSIVMRRAFEDNFFLFQKGLSLKD